MGLALRQMAVIVVLMNDHDRRRAVNDRPIFFAGFVDHPIIPTGSADTKVRDVGIAGLWKEEKIASGGTMEGALTVDGRPQTIDPIAGKVEGVSDIQIPALAQQNKFSSKVYLC